MPVRYIFDGTKPTTQYYQVEIAGAGSGRTQVKLQMPAWRPGRYELGNFYKNIRSVKAWDQNGDGLKVSKEAKDVWVFDNPTAQATRIVYELYAPVLNAGSTFLDPFRMQIMPVNACLMVTGCEYEPHSIELKMPETFRCVSGMTQSAPLVFEAPHFDRLADSPIVGSTDLLHVPVPSRQPHVHAWFTGINGSVPVQVAQDIARMVDYTIGLFGSLPEKEYHFFFHATVGKSHHGVEHENSTIIQLGPAADIFQSSYLEFLAITCHEFYHTWNIKKIRPVEMVPYDLTRENYSYLGYVAEGVTTFMGDFLLLRSGVVNYAGFLELIEDELLKHFHNYGRFNQSVADASFDTWVDGYEPGIPHKKTSIYTEGSLLSLVADITILYNTNGKSRIDSVMKSLYDDLAQSGKGYTEADYKSRLEQIGLGNWDSYFQNYIHGVEDYEPLLQQAFDKVGLMLVFQPNPRFLEKNWGMKWSDDSNKITAIAPDSPAQKAGFMLGDILISINNYPADKHLHAIAQSFAAKHTRWYVKSGEHYRTLECGPPEEGNFYPVPRIRQQPECTEEQTALFHKWIV